MFEKEKMNFKSFLTYFELYFMYLISTQAFDSFLGNEQLEGNPSIKPFGGSL